ncbi:uncharacterized protein LOC105631085 [Jatropha curcas]|uniref:uncharacterized protein LOC105631085 n=1 Tax=Jatropha curcas TaxID=180498 RepID=UPI0018955AE9|nr:uncharacterized protein LOC105631085 [Jatropha curcas]XP_037494433.1 uncharacterized protein LOC105631085 [Jatropha curcas]
MSIKLKALVDKANNRVIFAESDGDFVDVLFSFLTMPIGTIVRLTNNRPPITAIGCMNNLYASVEKLDAQRFRTEACKTMLLRPKNGSATQYKDLKLKIDRESATYFYCGDFSCISSKCKLLSQYAGSYCDCGRAMNSSIEVNTIGSKDSIDRTAFAKEFTRFLISDELQVIPSSTAASFSLISKLGIMDMSSTEERVFSIGFDEVLNLLKSLFVSNFPLTETFLRPKELPDFSKKTFQASSIIKHQLIRENARKENVKMCARLFLSKSKKRVCYAEVGDDFVDLLFSFLTIPLGFIMKEMNGAHSKGCIDYLYKSIMDLDSEKYFKTNGHKEILLSPKIAPDCGYENQLLGVKEVAQPLCYFKMNSGWSVVIYLDKPTSNTSIALRVKDPKSTYKSGKTGGAFVMGPAMFTVTDDLIVTPISPISGLSVLNKLNIPFNDIEELNVHVGNEEASRLLVASFMSESALTETFLQKKIKEEC